MSKLATLALTLIFSIVLSIHGTEAVPCETGESCTAASWTVLAHIFNADMCCPDNHIAYFSEVSSANVKCRCIMN
ncbi:hypothetical protein V1264_020284 [Littorina saxatilis]|uniref:Uncharacterized protein n=1 Tax=Littorina saxatilis TaxID=31220 RepID=A0AAN9GAP6_9CAEN